MCDAKADLVKSLSEYSQSEITSMYKLAWGRKGVTLDTGTVVNKIHEDERIWTSTTFIKSGDVTIPVTSTHIDDEDWIIVIEDCWINEDKVKECGTDTIYATESNWSSVEIGDEYTLQEGDSHND